MSLFEIDDIVISPSKDKRFPFELVSLFLAFVLEPLLFVCLSKAFIALIDKSQRIYFECYTMLRFDIFLKEFEVFFIVLPHSFSA